MTPIFVLAAAAAAFVTMETENPSGYLASPASGKGQGVLVLHPWWGLNRDVKAYCDRLAAEGLFAFAPDLFGGRVATSVSEAEALVKEHDAKYRELSAQIVKAAEWLGQRSGKKQIAVVGFSFGAFYALHLSNEEPDRIHKVVIYYGSGQEDFSKSKASYLGHFADNDPYEPRASVDALTELLKKSNRPETMHVYANTGHWFAEPSRPDAYRKAEAELAWTRTLAFLKGTE
jgi:carboxymethylenebutenolidase